VLGCSKWEIRPPEFAVSRKGFQQARTPSDDYSDNCQKGSN
jgi:hypothetical protein